MSKQTAMQLHIIDLKKALKALEPIKAESRDISISIQFAIENAKYYLEKEKEQIIDARLSVTGLNHRSPTDDNNLELAEQYFNQTYNQ